MYGSLCENINIKIIDPEIVYASFFPCEEKDGYDGSESDEIVIKHKPLEPSQWVQSAVFYFSINARKSFIGSGLE